MRAFYLLLLDAPSSELRRIDFSAEGPDHAFQVARNEGVGTHVELWEGDALLAKMTKSGANIWKLLPTDTVFDSVCETGRSYFAPSRQDRNIASIGASVANENSAVAR